MKKQNELILFLVFIISITKVSFAKIEQFTNLNHSLKSRYLIKTSHLENIENHVSLASPSLLQQWEIIGGGVEAHYNEYLNLLVIDKDKIINGQVKSYYEFKKEEKEYSFSTFASTLFHELAHADYDIFIEESDSNIRFLLNHMLKRWVARNIKGYSNRIVRHEILGYSAGGVIELLDYEISNVLFKYGYVFSQDKCMSKSFLKKTAKNLNLRRDFVLENHREDIDYAEKITPSTIWVKGKEINIDAYKLPKIYKYGIFNYFKTTYQIPSNRSELIEKINESHFIEKVRKCYADIL
ncbi:MAG: hypothetical protein HN576_09190 [Bacteriovoracaceae bacterium]|nr:hypothetical protein [Bacteriovoracaceae bacterium]